MKRFIFLAALAGAVIIPSIEHAAYAQPAAAIGKPLPDGGLPAGTISVRVVAGAPSSPVVGTEVTLLVNNEPRMARTDSAGRAAFPNVPAGANVQAKAQDAAGKDTMSEVFQVPASGGVRVMLTTKPFASSGGMPPAMGGQGMPQAREMSGTPRADRGVAPGSYQVRVTYNNLTISEGVGTDPEPPIGESVFLVGYNADESVTTHVAKVNAQGHAQFDGLDVSGNIVYFALTRLPRNGNVDRLAAVPVQLETQAGAKLILSSEKRTSNTPQIDDLAGPSGAAMPQAGKVVVTLEGYPRELSEIRLVDAVTKQVVGKGQPTIAPPDPTKVEGGAQFQPDPSLPAGTVDIRVHGGAGMKDNALADVAVRVVPSDATNIAEGVASKTSADGTVRLAVADKTKKYRLMFNINGKELGSDEFDVAASGGKLDVYARWEEQGRPQIVFDVPYNPAHVLYAETRQMSPLTDKVETFRTMPFQPIETMGAAVAISVLPRILFSFELHSFVEDEILAVRGLWAIRNSSWIPYRDTADGMLVKLPKGHVGGVVGDQYQSEVSVAQGEGYRILRALPPGVMQWEAGFSMKSEDGKVDWRLDLPLGTFQSAIQIRHFETLEVQGLPENVNKGMKTGKSGTPWFVISEINIRPNQSMVMTISGLPSHAPWKKWVPRAVGVLALLIMLAGILFALMHKKTAEPSAEATADRKKELMDELVELEKKGVDSKRRDQVLAELERIWE